MESKESNSNYANSGQQVGLAGQYYYRGKWPPLPSVEWDEALLEECLNAASSIEEAAERYFFKKLEEISSFVTPTSVDVGVRKTCLPSEDRYDFGYIIVAEIELPPHFYVDVEGNVFKRDRVTYLSETYLERPSESLLTAYREKLKRKLFRVYDPEELKKKVLGVVVYDHDAPAGSEIVESVDLICGFSWEAQLCFPKAAEMIKAAKERYCQRRKTLAVEKLKDIIEELHGREIGRYEDGKPVKLVFRKKKALLRVPTLSFVDRVIIVSTFESALASFGYQLVVTKEKAEGRTFSFDKDLIKEILSTLNELERVEEEKELSEG